MQYKYKKGGACNLLVDKEIQVHLGSIEYPKVDGDYAIKTI